MSLYQIDSQTLALIRNKTASVKLRLNVPWRILSQWPRINPTNHNLKYSANIISQISETSIIPSQRMTLKWINSINTKRELVNSSFQKWKIILRPYQSQSKVWIRAALWSLWMQNNICKLKTPQYWTIKAGWWLLQSLTVISRVKCILKEEKMTKLNQKWQTKLSLKYKH